MFICTVCTESLDFGASSNAISACPCGHLFHSGCLERWFLLSVKRTCPQCRERAPPSKMIQRLYFQEGALESFTQSEESVETLKRKISDLTDKLSEKSKKILLLETDLEKSRSKCTLAQNEVLSLRKIRDEAMKTLSNYELLNQHLKVSFLKIKELTAQLDEVKSFRAALEGTQLEFEEEMNRHTCKQTECQSLVKLCSLLKRETHKFSHRQEENNRREEGLRTKLRRALARVKELEDALEEYKNRSCNKEELKTELESMKSEIESFQRKKNFLSDFSKAKSVINVSLIDRIMNESPLPSKIRDQSMSTRQSSTSPQIPTAPLLYVNEDSNSKLKGYDGLGGRKLTNYGVWKSKRTVTNSKNQRMFGRKKTT